MTAIRTTLLGVFLGSIPSWPAVALSQEPGSPVNPEGPAISVRFTGGTLGDFVKALKEASSDLNIVMTVPDAKAIRLPAVQLDSVAPTSALELLQGVYQLEDGSSVRLFVSSWGGPPGAAANAVFKIWSEQVDRPRSPTQVRVWNLGGLIGPEYEAKAILTAIETAVSLLQNLPPAQIRYHEETKLLLASGVGEQLAAIERVIEGLKQGMDRARTHREAYDWSRLTELIAAMKSRSEGPGAGQDLQAGAKDREFADLLGALTEELRQRDHQIAVLERELKARERK